MVGFSDGFFSPPSHGFSLVKSPGHIWAPARPRLQGRFPDGAALGNPQPLDRLRGHGMDFPFFFGKLYPLVMADIAIENGNL